MSFMKQTIDMRIRIILSCFVLASLAVSASGQGTVVKLDACRKCDTGRPDEPYVIEVVREFDGIRFSAYFDCELGSVPDCQDKAGLPKRYHPNSITVNDQVVFLGRQLKGTGICLCIPMRLFYGTTAGNTYVVLEMANISYTTVGGGYCYITVKPGSYSISEWQREPASDISPFIHTTEATAANWESR